MNKAIILSVRPEHAYNILSCEKTLELRKSVPKGFKGWVYAYVMKGKPYITMQSNVINGTIPFRFWFDEWEEVLAQHHIDSEQIERILKQACIEPEDLDKYVGDKESIYAWHIKQLDIFYEPMELGEFVKDFPYASRDVVLSEIKNQKLRITKAPQSYQYVWVTEELK